MNNPDFDIIIVGAGPAGAATCIALQGSGLKIALLDKSTFPRDKICGDALSPDVVNQLNKLPLDSGPLFDQLEAKIDCLALKFVSPNFNEVDLKLNKKDITGYISKRIDFDHFMYQRAVENKDVTSFAGIKVNALSVSDDSVQVALADGTTFTGSIVLGADGANSFVKRQLQPEPLEGRHHSAGLRQYYKGVTGFSEGNAIELHFYKELLPGYFWMFPLANGEANIGMGMLSRHVSKKKVNLKKLLEETIKHHPNVKHRFVNAVPLESPKGLGLPLGSKKRPISGNRYLLLGDAASLINPLSGEGIGNAIRSGRIAADYLKIACEKNRFDAKANKAYDQKIYKSMWKELQLNYWLQRIMTNETLCNLTVSKSLSNESVQNMILSGFDIDNIRNQLKKPSFYLNIFRS